MKIGLRTAVPVVGVGLLAMATIGVCKKNNNESNESVRIGVRQSNRVLDLNKTNLPKINGDVVEFTNTDGNQVKVKGSSITKSLYQAIKKFSKPENPTIDDVESFYSEVEKNIPKANLTLIGYSQSKLASDLFSRMYDNYTLENSDSGKSISVKEYTEMMDAWTSTAKNN